MRNTPLNGPDGSGRDGGDSPDPAATDGGFRGLVGRVRDALQRVGAGLKRRLGTRDDPSDGDRREATGTRGRRSRSVERSKSTVDRERTNRPVLADHGEDRPVPAERDAGPRERPELVARWHDDRLTLSEPNEAGAQLSSDTWAEVDP